MPLWHNLNHNFYLSIFTFATQKINDEENTVVLFNDFDSDKSYRSD